jgi:hypothetical protein
MIGDVKLVDKIIVDLYNKKVLLRGDDNSVVTLKCSSINELVELIEECKKLLKTDNILVR